MSTREQFPLNGTPAEAGAGHEGDALSVGDAAALDALVEAGFDPGLVAEGLRERAARVAAVLGLVSAGGDRGGADSLIEVTLARVAAERDRAAAGGPVLSAEDDDALEALVAAGMDAERTHNAVRRRARRHRALLGLLEVPASETGGAEGLVGATLARVQGSIERQESRMKAEPAAAPGWRPRLADLTTVAALLLIGGAVLVPMAGAVRGYSNRLACQSNLSTAGLAFTGYAADYRDSLPMASASVAGNPWWNVGTREQSNSANLYTLTRASYAGVSDLACAGHAEARRTAMPAGAVDWRTFDEVSYSYQNLFARPGGRPSWNGSVRAVIVTDRSPVVVRAYRRQVINPVGNSMNHGERGQNALFNDGSVAWMKTPVLENGDNIWLPRNLEAIIARLSDPTRAERIEGKERPIEGTENPVSADDAFVAP